jgi:Flp pilus assembly protein TadD
MTYRIPSLLALVVLAAGCAHRQASSGTLAVKIALAHRFAERGQLDAAFAEADSACREAPDDGAARAIRGALLSDRGMLDEAAADLEEAVRLAPDLAEAHAALAVLQERRQRPDDAEKEHRKAVELAPRDARYLNNLGYALLLHDKAKEAVAVLLEAARIDPMSRRIRNNLGFAYARLNDYARAKRQFALGGTPAEAQNNLGITFERAGNLAQARSHYREALRLDPRLGVARENLTRLGGEAPAAAGPDAAVGAVADKNDEAQPGAKP